MPYRGNGYQIFKPPAKHSLNLVKLDTAGFVTGEMQECGASRAVQGARVICGLTGTTMVGISGVFSAAIGMI